ncbi:hypothetical protein QG37_08355 [Candidozyma auris]|uniref:Uncharacterized protein n=1 Tax=Candidozyma auris TaxID=498019 RepID=A0A0L0NMZ6_CANAR|nr:hypothetical protein QG37_08355 [[Candida] auris]
MVSSQDACFVLPRVGFFLMGSGLGRLGKCLAPGTEWTAPRVGTQKALALRVVKSWTLETEVDYRWRD